MFVWLINHIHRWAASYDGTGVSEGDQSLGRDLRSPLDLCCPTGKMERKIGSREPRAGSTPHRLTQPLAALVGVALKWPVIYCGEAQGG